MSSESNAFVDLAAKHHPRFLEAFAAKYAGRPPSFWADAEPHVCGFELACRCGNFSLSASGVIDQEIGIFGPIHVSCNDCGSRHLLFDVAAHGYDGEYGHGTGYPEVEGDADTYRCVGCGADWFRMNPWCTYQFESLDEFSDIPTNQISNYFDVFGVAMLCLNCGEESEIGPYECA